MTKLNKFSFGEKIKYFNKLEKESGIIKGILFRAEQ